MDNGASSYRRFLNGDDKGLGEIVRDYADGLTLYLNGIVNNISLAEELMEETFFRLITKKPKFHPKHAFKTFLYTIGRNVAIDHLRRSAKISDTSFEALENYIQDEYDLENLYIIEQRKITVHRALKKLNTDYRQVLWLLYFEDLSHAEAARRYHLTKRRAQKLESSALHNIKTGYMPNTADWR